MSENMTLKKKENMTFELGTPGMGHDKTPQTFKYG